MKSFRLINIKGFVDTGHVELKPITLILGKNSSGKSSIQRFPLVLRQTFLDDSMSPLLFYGKSIDYGNFEDVIFNHKGSFIAFELTIEKKQLERVRPGPFRRMLSDITQEKELILNAKINQSRNNKELNTTSFRVLEPNNLTKPIFSVDYDSKNRSYKISAAGLNTSYPREKFEFEKFLPDFRNFFPYNENNGERFERYYYLFNMLNTYLNQMASSIFYIGPFRRTPERYYRYTENAVNYVGSAGEFFPVILGQDGKSDGQLIEDVSSWLSENMNYSLEVQDQKSGMFKVVMTDMETNVSNNLIDVGHGLSQLIPILVQVAMMSYPGKYMKRGLRYPLIVIEQPELHLHPAAQCSLADLFVNSSNKNCRYLIETHSEHMLLRLRKYIAMGKISPNDVAIYYTEKNGEGRYCEVRRLPIDNDGKIDQWPEGFFSQDYYESLAYRKVLLSKKNYHGGDE